LSERGGHRGRNLRRIGIVLVAAFVAMGTAGAFGQRTSSVSATGGGYRLTVDYPSVVRPGLPVRWNVTVQSAAGFRDPIQIAVSRHYFDLFDLNSFRPDASSSTSTGDLVVYTFEPPPGDTFTMAMDASVEAGEHLGLDAVTALRVRGVTQVQVTYHTRVVP
jgi:hypothetical protein